MPSPDPDPALLSLLPLTPTSHTTITPLSSGCSSARTHKVTTTSPARTFFLKTGANPSAGIMFAGEHASLTALSTAVPTLCPRPLGHGTYSDDPSTAFLLTEFLSLSPRGRTSSSSSSSAKTKNKPMTLAQKLGKLHSTPAPVPEGYASPQFGFPVPTCCGDTRQDNTYEGSWARFYAERRLRFILREAERNQGGNKEVRELVERTCMEVVPRLIGDERLDGGKGVRPVVVHGDLWSGNAGRGRLGEGEEEEEVVFDSSACYAHSEFELGIMSMFGGFGVEFLTEYHAIVPKTEPVQEYEDRVRLYELYHHLNHYAMFGGGYKSGAVGIMRALLEKYGGGEGRKGEL